MVLVQDNTEPYLPVFQPMAPGAGACRVCVVTADAFDGIPELPNLATIWDTKAGYYSGALSGGAYWDEDRAGLGKCVRLNSQNPGDFIDICGATKNKWAHRGLMGAGATRYEQTIIMYFRKLNDTTFHACYGNWSSTIGTQNRVFYFWVPSSASTSQAVFNWAGTSLVATLPAAIDYNIPHVWAATVGSRGMEIWRDGNKIGSNASTPGLNLNFAGSLNKGPTIGDGIYASKPFGYNSGLMNFKLLYTFERQLEVNELTMLMNDLYCLVRPQPIWTPYDIGPLNNRIEITTPVEILVELPAQEVDAVDAIEPNPVEIDAEVQSPAQTAADSVEPTPVEVDTEVQEPSQSAVDNITGTPAEVLVELPAPELTPVDTVEPNPVETLIEIPSQEVDAVDTVEPDPVETLIEVQEPSQEAADTVEPDSVEIQVEVQSPGQAANDAVLLEPVEIDSEVVSPSADAADTILALPVEVQMEVQQPLPAAIDALVTQAVETLMEIQQPDLEVTEGVTVTPVEVNVMMQVQPPSLTDIVSVVTQAAEVLFYIARTGVTTEDDLFYTHKQAIHNAIVDAIQSGVFLPVTYDPATKLMEVPTDEEDAVPPASFAANDLTCVFGLPERNRRERIMERGSWRWQVIVQFDREVVAEPFEETLLASPILLAKDTNRGLRQIIINLIDADYIHPPKQNPSSGTQVTYTFEARLGPV